jgi:drug/metabolite transporter (DMT)-like permease
MKPYGAGIALLSAALFGASTPASKLLLASLGPFQLAGLLYLGAALGMLPIFVKERRAGDLPKLDRPNLIRLIGAVVTGGILGPVLLLFGLRLALAGSVSLLLNLEMAATAALGVLFFREHLGRAGWLAVVGVIASGAIVSWDAGWPGVLAGTLVAAACICWGLDNHFTATIDGMSPSRSTFWKGSIAGATNLVVGLTIAPFHASVTVVGFALAVGALSYGVSIALYIASAQQLGATRAQAFFASAPFIGAALSFGFPGEPPAPAHPMGGALLAISVAVLFLSQHEHRHVHEATEHIHAHRHDEGHHIHDHPGLSPEAQHTHWHRHERLAHAHPHWPDLHHRHRHRGTPS